MSPAALAAFLPGRSSSQQMTLCWVGKKLVSWISERELVRLRSIFRGLRPWVLQFWRLDHFRGWTSWQLVGGFDGHQPWDRSWHRWDFWSCRTVRSYQTLNFLGKGRKLLGAVCCIASTTDSSVWPLRYILPHFATSRSVSFRWYVRGNTSDCMKVVSRCSASLLVAWRDYRCSQEAPHPVWASSTGSFQKDRC